MRSNWAALAIGVLLALALAEVALRVLQPIPDVANPLYAFHEADPVLGWRGKPNARMRFRRPDFDVFVAHGPEGFRAPDPAPPASPHCRLLVLGDSFVWGWGVGQGEVVTDEIQRSRPDCAVVNRGVNGFGTAQQLLLLRRELATTRYDAVALLFYGNDVADNLSSKRGRRPLFVLDEGRLVPRNQPPAALIDPVQRALRDYSRVYQTLDFGASVLEHAWERPTPLPAQIARAGKNLRFEDLPGAAVTLALLDTMAQEARDAGSRFVLISIPNGSELTALTSPYPVVRATRALLEEASRRHGIPWIDLTPAFHAATQAGAALVYPRDAHWTPAGHRLAAESLLAAGLLTDPGAPLGD